MTRHIHVRLSPLARLSPLLTTLDRWLVAHHAANVRKAKPWLPGHGCHTTKGKP